MSGRLTSCFSGTGCCTCRRFGSCCDPAVLTLPNCRTKARWKESFEIQGDRYSWKYAEGQWAPSSAASSQSDNLCSNHTQPLHACRRCKNGLFHDPVPGSIPQF